MQFDYNNWQKENQYYLMGMIGLVRNQLENYIKSAENKQNFQSDSADKIQDLKRLAESMQIPPALDTLVNKLNLSSFERDILLLCAGAELDSEFSNLLSTGGSRELFSAPSFSLASAIFEDPDWSAFTPSAPLRYWRMVEVNKSQLLTKSPLKINEPILHYLAGVHEIHEKLEQVTTRVYPQDLLVTSEHGLADTILQTLIQHSKEQILPVLQFFGGEPADKLRMAAHVSTRLGLSLYSISIHSIPNSIEEITELSRLWNREATLKNYALFLDADNLDLNDKVRIKSLIHFIDHADSLILIGSEQWMPVLKKTKFAFDIKKPAADEQLLLWRQILGETIDGQELEKLVSQFNLSAETIQKAGREIFSYRKINGLNGEPDTNADQQLWKICCRQTRPQMDELALYIEPAAEWDDLVLPETQKNILKEIAIHVRQRNKVYGKWGFEKKGTRGLGISALFSGESGTGKTMAAEVLANELNLDLYKIDLSKVINKYIGETEKNLKKIFDAAENGGAILLFDEADALFGKRSDVKDSHDRYSNMEVSYLLQRMEAYRGLAILTTNMKSALDKAFMRRIRFVVQFPFPDYIQRVEIWSKVFPQSTPKGNLDLDQLAKLNLCGGSIRNVALNAAFIAADENKSVMMSHISRAAKSEYLKLEKPFSGIEIK